MADIAKELRKIAKPTKVLAGLGPNGAVYRTDRHPNEKLLKRAADALDAAHKRIAALEAALRNLRICSNAIVGADPYDDEAQEAFEMFNIARDRARILLASPPSRIDKEDGNGRA